MEQTRIKMTARKFFAMTGENLLEQIKKDGYLEMHIDQETGELRQSKIDSEDMIIKYIVNQNTFFKRNQNLDNTFITICHPAYISISCN